MACWRCSRLAWKRPIRRTASTWTRRRTPFHVGLDRWIKFDKGDFVGREALLKVRDKGVDERWTGLILDGDMPAATDARVLAGGEDAGVVTYSDHGYSLGKVLATAHLRLPFTAIGTELSIDIDGKPTRAVVAPMPFFDPEGVRLRPEQFCVSVKRSAVLDVRRRFERDRV